MGKTILSVGHMEFPLGQAQVQRQLLMAKAIMLEGFKVTVLCRYGIHKKSDGINNEGSFEGVNYIYCSGSSVRPQSFIKRNQLKFKGLINEIIWYNRFSKEKQLAGIIVSTNSFYNILFYYFLGKIFNVITIVDNVEYWTSIKNEKIFDRLDKWLYDRFYFHFADKIICISDFLISKINESVRNKVIKIPVITDFDKYKIKVNDRIVNERYFLFCGSENYFELIDFVISSFEQQSDNNNYSLVLVTRPSEELKTRLEKSKVKIRIIVFANIQYVDLINLYCNSEALLIPMRDTDQDRARFPHKISEYCAAGRPIITNRIGEINNYFDETNAYLCNEYSQTEFSDTMRKVISDSEKAERIARKSYQRGEINFNYKSYSKLLIDLFKS